jgi:hypothetical protein
VSAVADNFLSTQCAVHFTDSERRQVYVLSGTCILDPVLLGDPHNNDQWQRGQTYFQIPVPDLPVVDGVQQGFVVEQAAPAIVLGSIENEQVATNAGWAVDDFAVEVDGESSEEVTATFNYAVRDNDGQMRRVAYTITLVGYYAPLPIIQ